MKMLAMKGKHQISSFQCAEWGSLVTLVICMSPSGHFVPPLLLFPRKNMKQEVMNGTPWINPHMPSLKVDTERDFFPVVSSFHQT
jgi:hypothetical protein